MLNAPIRQEAASLQSLSQGIDIGSVLVLHPPLYSPDSPVSFFSATFEPCAATASSTPEEPSMSVMLAIWLLFKTRQFS